MSNVAYTLRFVLSDNRFEPAQPQAAGTRGDHRAARLVFTGLEAGAGYRLEVVDGGGAYDITELISAPSGSLTYEVPSSWTAPGTAQVRVVKVGDGEDTPCLHYPPVYLYFADREDGEAAGEMLPRWQAVMTRLETSVDTAAASAADAAQAAREAQASASAAQHVAATVQKGDKGDQGDKGDKGDTPVRGVDYWTAADKAETNEYIDEQIGGIEQAVDGVIAVQEELIENGTTLAADYVVAQGPVMQAYADASDNVNFTYRKWNSGLLEVVGGFTFHPTICHEISNIYFCGLANIKIQLFDTGDATFVGTVEQCFCSAYSIGTWATILPLADASYGHAQVTYYSSLPDNTAAIYTWVYLRGRWK